MSKEGSAQPDQAENSQGWRSQLRTLVSEFFSTLRDTGRKVGDVGPVILKIQNILGVDPHCRPLTTSGKRSLYPLPTPDLSGGMANRGEFLQATVQALNSLHGCLGPPRTVTEVAASALKRLQRIVSESPFLDEPLEEFSFSEFFKTKSLDYMGDEIKVAKSIVWEGVAASLPSQVGSLDIRDFCTGGVLHYVNHVDEYLLPVDGQFLGKTPKTMVASDEWYKVAHGLIKSGLCEVMVEKELYHIGSRPLLNGLFAVSKNEFQGDVELLRLIMNLKPLNQNTRALEGDTCTLPSITSLGAMFLDDDEMLCTSSEDIKCFFYLFRVPSSWKKYMGFGRPVPKQLLPQGCSGQVGYLVSRVLPMGYLNSVAIAQHIHRNVVRRCMGSLVNPVGGQQELRRDRVHSNAPLVFRVYLDNFDQLQRVNRSMALLLQGKPSPVVQQLRTAYEEAGLPRHPGKSVQQEWLAEVQGALVDGAAGQVCAKPSKFVRYLCLVLQVVGSGRASQKELQVIGGGLVYLCMFRRPLLCSLNALWTCIVQLEGRPRTLRVLLPKVVIRELVRFVGLVPLAYMNLRSKFVDTVSASDASSTGGGFCLSKGITPYGLAASRSSVRGDLPEPHDFGQVLTVGLFDGIAALRVSTDILGLAVAGHISVEKMDTAQRVVEANFPDTITVPAIEQVTEELVIQWSLRFSNVCLVLIGGGPPCQGVSGLNSDRRGALRDSRSSLFQQVPGIVQLFRKHFPWAQTHYLLESEGRATASNVLAALQDFDPKLRGQLPGSWRLMRTWTVHEVPVRAPPMTENVLKAMIGWSFFNDHWAFGVSLMVGFFGLLRTGELLALQAWQVHMVSPNQPAVINLGLTKSGKRQGAEESITISDVHVLRFLWAWKSQASDHSFLTAKPHQWRAMFQRCLEELKLDEWGFRPYSLRRGAATFFFTKLGSLDKVLVMGRWTAAKTARIYINSGLAMLAELKISQKLLRPYITVYQNSPAKMPQLEPSPKGRRAGASGKAKKRSKNLVLKGRMGLEPRKSIGTSSFVVLATSCSAVCSYIHEGLASLRAAGAIAVTAVISARMGAAMTNKVKPKTLKKGFGAWLLIVSLVIMAKALHLLPVPWPPALPAQDESSFCARSV
eukprot:Skav232993  [mRNA]  locus=scaffold387:64192:70081:+ [translate_table: standard]